MHNESGMSKSATVAKPLRQVKGRMHGLAQQYSSRLQLRVAFQHFESVRALMAPVSDPSSASSGYSRPNILRKASLILPSGTRIHRSSLRNYTLRTDVPSESTPLLGSRSASPDDSVSQHSKPTVGQRFSRFDQKFREFTSSRLAKNILKCSLAYFLGSLATFVTPISGLLGKYDGKHMVATIAVYFHPARTAGSMHEATLFAIVAFVYSTMISVGSMALSILFAKLELIALGHALVLIIFCAGGLGFIGYVKHVMSSPTVSTACSLASISIITILCKEGSVQLAQFSMGKIFQVSQIILMAIVVSNFLAFTLWPSSAVTELRQLMIKSTDSFSDMLSTITRSFLSGSEDELLCPEFTSVAADHRTVFISLTKTLREAKYEHYLKGNEQEYQLEKRLVECMQRLAQHIGGLRSAAATQFGLLRQAHKHMSSSSNVDQTPQESTPPTPQPCTAPENSGSFLNTLLSASPLFFETFDEIAAFEEDAAAPIAVFDEFIKYLGPPMKSLAYTLKLMLDELPFAPGPTYTIQINHEFKESLRKAITLYSEARVEALNTLYRSEQVTKKRPMAQAADVEEIAASCGYFSYCLQYFAEEMITFLDILDKLEDIQIDRPKSWEWMKFWKKVPRKEKKVRDDENPGSVTATPVKRQPTIPNLSPSASVPLSYKLWKALKTFRKPEVQYSIKVGIGAALYASLAFISYTRPTFSLWRGEWGLVSYMIVMSMTIGQTNTSGEARVVGTVIGAVLALTAWIVFPENPYALSVFGWLVSLPCFWIILTWKQATFGRFILLTYNLSALYAFSLSVADDDDDDDEGGLNPIITEIVLHRFVAVTVGVIWSVFINRAIWPVSARRMLRKGLSVLWLRMALVWKQDPLNCLIQGQSDKTYINLAEERSLQTALLRLGSLTSAAPHEFRLKGPFPTKEYGDILKANQSIIDAFHGMSVMITNERGVNKREADILAHTRQEREILCSRMSHLFYILASSIRLGFPLLENVPNADLARDRLLAKLFNYREKIRGAEGEVDKDFALIYAYVLVTGRISEGLAECIRNVELLYGVLEEETLEI